MSGSAVLLACAQELNRRCLRVGAKWALELHSGMAPALPPGLEAVHPALCPTSPPLEEAEEGTQELARAYIAGKEFARAAHLLDRRYAPGAAGAAAAPATYPPGAFFLRCYALYLVRLALGVCVGGPWVRCWGWCPAHAHTPWRRTPHDSLNTTPLHPTPGLDTLAPFRMASAGGRLSARRARRTF